MLHIVSSFTSFTGPLITKVYFIQIYQYGEKIIQVVNMAI